jgi:hypothetical protein
VSGHRTAYSLAHALRAERLDPDLGAWEALIRSARQADVLGTLASRLESRGSLVDVPPAPRNHLIAARQRYRAQERAVRREVELLHIALESLNVPVILLKGVAYLLAELPPAAGRMFSDIDILVPRDSLPGVEAALMLAGFATMHPHPYDQAYYRRWMHELPPMQHVKRSTVLDVHHALVAGIGRPRIDPQTLLTSSVPLVGQPGFRVLGPVDMVLHSAAHLFSNEDFTHAYRDLVDLDALLVHFGDDARFWEALPRRANELGLGRPLHYALHWTSSTFGTAVPTPVTVAARAHAPYPGISWLMNLLVDKALRPDARDPATAWARRALRVRGHWLKMPMLLLAWHLTMKALRRKQPG